MKKIDKVIVITALALALAVSNINLKMKQEFDEIPKDVVIAYSKWRQFHDQLASSPDEQKFRLGVSYQTYKLVKEVNINI